MTKVLILGSTGMLGSAITQAMEGSPFEVLTASRSTGIRFDAGDLNSDALLQEAGISSGDWIINCVGLTKARIDQQSAHSRAAAVRLNFDFPDNLAVAAANRGARILQVATDCVFSGETGSYNENSPHDAKDVYGKTKSLGEVPSDNVMHLRCSLIGPEQGRNSLFFEWVRQQALNSSVTGFTDHIWNGLTSQAFGRIARGIIAENLFAGGVQHLVPEDIVTKAELVQIELDALGRNDVTVSAKETGSPVDRTLTTLSPAMNEAFFAAAGYSKLPSIDQMVKEACADLPI